MHLWGGGGGGGGGGGVGGGVCGKVPHFFCYVKVFMKK